MVKCFSQKRNKYKSFPAHIAKNTKALNDAGWVVVQTPIPITEPVPDELPVEPTIVKKPKRPLTKTTI
jgi:hypothetical protein